MGTVGLGRYRMQLGLWTRWRQQKCNLMRLPIQSMEGRGSAQMWRWAVKKNVPPDNTITNTLIYWLCKSGMVGEARKLFDELEKGTNQAY
ncbi:hypothetical protein ZWY2020_014088 [Hordeum vulgare]|nr:hypothetical protein ZWY2020_014088 [Hordeum vulgare]